jgi:hypothetical protein
MELSEIIHQYVLKVGDLSVPVPYWINWNDPPYFLDAPYRGKGSPGQLRRALERVLAAEPMQPTTVEGVRQLMRRHGLGVDCSGLAYHVLSRYLRYRGRILSEGLVVHRAELEAALERHPERRSSLDAGPLPETMTLAEVCRRWRKAPVMITSVRRLVDSATATVVPTAGEVRAGDLIKMTSAAGDHIAVVVAVRLGEIEYAASEDSATGLGGLRHHLITVAAPGQGLEHQEWDQHDLYQPTAHGDSVWRLNILSR